MQLTLPFLPAGTGSIDISWVDQPIVYLVLVALLALAIYAFSRRELIFSGA